MSTETKMNYDLFGSLIMLKASLGVVLDRLEGDDICIVATAKFWLTPQDIENSEFLGSDETTGEVVLVLPNDWMGDEIPVVRVDSIDVEFIEEGE